jgi:hypothetical protein
MEKVDIAAEKQLDKIEEEEDCSQVVDTFSLPPEQNLTNILRADSLLS